jgi:hypothetical protein
MRLFLMLLLPCLLFSQQSREMRMSASPVPDSALIRSLGKPAKIWGALYVDTLHITHAGNIQISGFSNDAGYINSLQAGNKTYYGSQPVSPNSGDFWFDTTSAGQYLMKRWTWGQWKLVSVYMSDAGIYVNNITAGQIVGGKITADLLVADSIKAGKFTGLTFQTHATGDRIVIDNSDEITFYKGGLASPYIAARIQGILYGSGSLYIITNYLSVTGGIIAGSTISASGGSSTDWNEAHGWGDHASAGYIPYSDTTSSIAKQWELDLKSWIGHNHSGTYEPAISTLSIAKGGTNNTSYTDAQLLWYNYGTVSSSGYTAASFATSSHNQAWSTITSEVPTTLSGYGITDAHFDGSIPVTVYVASSSGGSPTTAISIYPINLGGTVLNALIKP